jgi:hypothetical protein
LTGGGVESPDFTSSCRFGLGRLSANRSEDDHLTSDQETRVQQRGTWVRRLKRYSIRSTTPEGHAQISTSRTDIDPADLVYCVGVAQAQRVLTRHDSHS